jgi:uncharacterized delta-60 repeat protein
MPVRRTRNHRRSFRARPRLERLEDRAVPTTGALDLTFGTGGLATADFLGPSPDWTQSVAVQADGKVVVAGSAEGYGGKDFALVRYNPNGSLDTSFGAGGRVLTDFGSIPSDGNVGDVASAVVVQADGKIVVAGTVFYAGTFRDFALARYNPDGSLDGSFGSGGKVTTDFGLRNDQAAGVVVQPDGKILVAGASGLNGESGFALARYNADGSLDTSFGSGGKVVSDFGTADGGYAEIGYAAALQGDGRIVVAGLQSFSLPTEGGARFALARYNADGSLDTSFGGGGGTVTTAFGIGGVAAAYAVAVQADGKIVAAGKGSTADDGFALVRYNADGSLDTSFDGDGVVTTSIGGRGSAPQADGLVIQPDGKLVAGGEFGPANFGVVRYNADGSLDASFGVGGMVSTPLRSRYQSGSGIALQPDGKLVLVGPTYRTATGSDFAVIRYNTDGGLDTSFDGDGVATTDVLAPSYDFASAVARQPDGKFVVAGSTRAFAGFTADPADPEFAVVRFNPDGSLDTTFGLRGHVLINFGGAGSASGVAIQPDGRIVVVGSSNGNFAVARLNADGSLDTSFNGNGEVITDFGGADWAGGVVLRSNGRIVVVGGSSGRFALAQYNADGSLDPGFDGDGTVTTAFGSSSGFSRAGGVALQGDGKLVVAGGTLVGGANGWDIALARYNLDGSLDGSFGSGGKVTTDVSARDEASAVALQTDGKIIVGSYPNFTVLRYNADGSRDLGFGAGGVASTPSVFGLSTDQGGTGRLALQADGKIVVTGYVQTYAQTLEFGTNLALVRYGADGHLDATFGDGGTLATGFGGSSNSGSDVVIQPDGRIVVAGTVSSSRTGNDFALARYEGALDGPVNLPPRPHAGGPYVVVAGGTVVLDGTASTDPNQPSDSLLYEWDLDGDGVLGETGPAAAQGDEVGPRPTFSSVRLSQSYGFNGTITLRVTDAAGVKRIDQTALAVISGPSVGVPGLPLDFRLSDTSHAPNGPLSYRIDWDGDGTIDQVLGPSQLQVQHAYTENGTYAARFYAVDALNDVSAPATLTVTITPVALITFGVSPVWAAGGTAGNDAFTIEPGTLADTVKLTVNGVAQDNIPSGPTYVFLYGLGGSDSYTVNLATPRNTYVYIKDSDGAGTDTLFVNGTADSETIVKSANSDGSQNVESWASPAGGDARYMLINATGLDHVYINSGAGDDTIIDPGDGATLLGGPGNDTIIINGTTGGGVLADGGPGSDTYEVTAGALLGPVTIADSGTSGSDSLTVVGTSGADAIVLSGGQVSVGGQVVTFTASLESLAIDGGGGADQVTVAGIPLVPAALSGVPDLVVVGTAGDDQISFTQGPGQEVRARLNGALVATATPTGRLVAYGLSGDDDIQVAGGITLPAWLYGGAGNDRLKGGSGSNVLLGGAGDDLLVGGNGRDILIGGAGADRIVGNAEDDILISGSTAFDGNEAALAAILAEWTSTRDYATRVANITGAGTGASFAARLNGGFFLRVTGDQATTTVYDDGAADVLTGSSGQDWYFANLAGSGVLDRVTDLSAAEFANDLSFIQGP